MERVGVDGVVALLGFLITPFGLEQYAVGHRVANTVSSPATEGDCQEKRQKTKALPASSRSLAARQQWPL